MTVKRLDELRPIRLLDAVVGPHDLRALREVDDREERAARVVRSERTVVRGMPVLRQDNTATIQSGPQRVDVRHDSEAIRNGEGALDRVIDEVIMDVNNEECVGRCHFVWGTSPTACSQFNFA